MQFLVDARLIALFFKGLKISDVGENGVMGSIPIKATNSKTGKSFCLRKTFATAHLDQLLQNLHSFDQPTKLFRTYLIVRRIPSFDIGA